MLNIACMAGLFYSRYSGTLRSIGAGRPCITCGLLSNASELTEGRSTILQVDQATGRMPCVDLCIVMVLAIDPYYRDQEQVHRDEPCTPAALAPKPWLAAKGMAYNSCCPMHGFDFDAVL